MKDRGSDEGLPPAEGAGSADVEELKAALRKAEDELARSKDKRAKRHRTRTLITGLLVVITSIVFTLAISAAWTRRTLFNTGQYVRTITPLVEHESVTDGLSEKLSTELLILIDAEGLAAEALPPRAQILAGPIVGAVEDFVRDQVRSVVESDRFAEFWVNANEFAHTQILAVLEEQSGAALSTEGGQVTLNLLPIINEVLIRVEDRAGGLLGKEVDLPEISGGELPDEARAKIEAALGVDVPENLGEIVVFESDKLEAAQDGLKLINKAVIVLLIAAVLLIALTLWISRRKRRTLIQLCAGILLGMVAVRRVVILMQEQAVDIAKPENKDAARAIVDDLMRNFFRLTSYLIAAALIAILIALVTGPYPWAVKLRRRTRDTVAALSKSVRERSQDDATTEWVQAHRDALQLGGVVAFVLAILVFNPSWLGFFVIAAVVGLFELAVYRLGQQPPPGPTPAN